MQIFQLLSTCLVQMQQEKSPLFTVPCLTDDRNIASSGNRGGIVEFKAEHSLTCIPMTSKRFVIMMAVCRECVMMIDAVVMRFQVLAHSMALIRANEYRNTRDVYYMNVALFEDQQAVVLALQV